MGQAEPVGSGIYKYFALQTMPGDTASSTFDKSLHTDISVSNDNCWPDAAEQWVNND